MLQNVFIKMGVMMFMLAGLLGAAHLGGAQAQTLRMAYDADPVSLDPHEQLSGGTLQLSHMTLDPLVRWTKELGFEPRLASSYERLDDQTTRFYLRKGVKFHSGRMMDADDAIWTFNRLRESEDFKSIFTAFKEMRKIDAHTVDIISDKGFPLVIHNATYIFIMDSEFYTGQDANGNDKAAIVKHGDSFASTNVSGTGAFIVTSREQGIKVEFERFADYWDKNTGNVQKIIFTPISEAPTRVAALLSGDVDFIAPVPPADLDRIEKDDDTSLYTMGGTRIITLQLNQHRVEAFKDAKVRNAIVYAINNDGIAKRIMRDFATTAGQMSPKGYLGYNPALTPRFDLAKAQALMNEAGYGDGFKITMMCPNNRYVNDAKICEASVAMLAKINIEVNLTTMPKAQYWPKFDERAADIMMIGWHADTEDSANFYEFLSMTPNEETGRGQYNSGNYGNAEIDALTIASLTEADEVKRAAMLQKVEKIMYDDAAFVPLHWQNLSWASSKEVDLAPALNVMNFPYLGDLVME